MRLVLVTHAFPPDGIAGVERYTQRLAARLVETGDTVTVVTRREGDSGAQLHTIRERLRDGTRVYRFAGGERPMDRFLAHHQRLEELFERVLIETNPEVVHVNHLFGHSPRFIEIAHKHRAAVVVTLHDYYYACPLIHLRKPSGELCDGPDGGRECARTCFAHQGADSTLRWGFRTVYFRRVLGTADRVITPSRYLSNYFEQFGVEPDCLHLLPHGIPYDQADRLGDDPPTPRERGCLNLAFFGSVVPHKGIHIIIDALAVAGLKAVTLTLFGPVPSYEHKYVQTLRERAAAISGLRLRIYGAYQQDQLHCLHQDIDCVIVPSQWQEIFGLVVLEAFVAGVPVIASRLGALPELVTEGTNGFTFTHDRPDELAALLQRLVAEEDLLRRLRSGARQTPLRTISQHTADVQAVYRLAVEDFSRRGRPKRAVSEELGFVHASLVNLGTSQIA
jgi:glycosyltransferase involved in cell wall biosynthesis